MRISDWSSDVCSSDLMFQHQNAVTRLPAIVPMAKRHLQRHFHAGRTAVGKENAGEARGRNGDKATRHVLGRFLSVASENDLIELLALLSDCRHNARVAKIGRETRRERGGQ